MASTVTIPRAVAEVINRAFLPTNPDQMRNATAEVRKAVEAFRAALMAAPIDALAAFEEELDRIFPIASRRTTDAERRARAHR